MIQKGIDQRMMGWNSGWRGVFFFWVGFMMMEENQSAYFILVLNTFALR